MCAFEKLSFTGRHAVHLQNCLFSLLEIIRTIEGFVLRLLQIMLQENHRAYANQNCVPVNVAGVLYGT